MIHFFNFATFRDQPDDLALSAKAINEFRQQFDLRLVEAIKEAQSRGITLPRYIAVNGNFEILANSPLSEAAKDNE